MTFDPQQPAQPEPFAPTGTTTPAPIPAPPAGAGSVGPGPITPATAPTLPAAAPATGARSSNGRLLNIVLGIAIAVAIGGVAFAVGRTTAPVSAASTTTGRSGSGQFPAASGAPAFGNGGQGGGGQFGGPAFLGRGNGLTITGTVASIDGDTVTISTADGRTIEVTLGSDTIYSTKSPGSASDVTDGSTVEVQLDATGGFRGGLDGGDDGITGQTPAFSANGITVVP